MEAECLKANLEKIDNVRVTREKGALVITNALPGYRARIRLAEVIGYTNLLSPHKQDCMWIALRDGGLIIVTPDDFVFSVSMLAHAGIMGMFPIWPLTDLIGLLTCYEEDPQEIESMNASSETDGTLGSYEVFRHVLKGALKKGINVDSLLENLERNSGEKGVREVAKR